MYSSFSKVVGWSSYLVKLKTFLAFKPLNILKHEQLHRSSSSIFLRFPEHILISVIKNSIQYYTRSVAYFILLHIQKAKMFQFFPLFLTNNRGPTTIDYISRNKLTFLQRKAQTLRFEGLSGIDFVQINNGKYQLLPQTICIFNT